MASAASPPPKSINIPAFTSPDPFSYMSRPNPQFKSSSPSAERRSLEGRYILDAHTSNDSATSPLPSIRIRHLSKGMTPDALTSMLLFAEDFIDATFTSTDEEDDTGFLAAIARFRTPEAAQEARSRLNGKVNPSLDATLIVEMMPPYGPRGSEDSDSLGRSLSSATRSPTSNGKAPRPSSRFNSTFQSMGGMVSGNASAISESQGSNGPSSVFDATSPRSSSFGEHFRVSGKSVIGGDADDDTGEILRDPVAYAKSGQGNLPRRQPSTSQQQQQQQQQLPISRLANLTLNTDTSNPRGLHNSPPNSGYRGMSSLQSPTSEMSPTNMRNGMAPANNPSAFPLGSPHIQRHHYPPANPADQNPPCNTLYVGNLPMDTSEDELKAVFSKQRGYKRLCFRTKHNGPMCFVEFEDISFATKALNELYGHPLHNSVKGGIRLSFSKNPLGVRSGQANSMGPNSPLASPTGMGFGNLGAPPGFATANGPPPGLGVPPGLSPPISTSGMTGFFNTGSPPSMASALQGSRGPGQYQSAASAGAHNPQSPIGSSFPDGVAGR